eukprot:gene40594-53683_t
MATSDAYKMMIRNIETMNSLVGFSVIIVCCSSAQQARYWQKRLEGGRGSVLPMNAIVLAVQEDWPGGAGNALGTLYAYLNAVELASQKHGMDLDGKLRAGEISVGLYHTAGPMLSESEWYEKGMHNYGLIAVNKNSAAAQVEKVDHSTAVKLLANLEEFNSELMTKKGKLDSDPHLWMPMTLDKAA